MAARCPQPSLPAGDMGDIYGPTLIRARSDGGAALDPWAWSAATFMAEPPLGAKDAVDRLLVHKELHPGSEGAPRDVCIRRWGARRDQPPDALHQEGIGSRPGWSSEPRAPRTPVTADLGTSSTRQMRRMETSGMTSFTRRTSPGRKGGLLGLLEDVDVENQLAHLLLQLRIRSSFKASSSLGRLRRAFSAAARYRSFQSSSTSATVRP